MAINSRVQQAAGAAVGGFAETLVDNARWALSNRQRPHLDRAPATEVLRIGVIGYGYWGPNVVRNFHGQKHSRVAMVCDQRPEALDKVVRAHPEIEVMSDMGAMLRSPVIDVVAI